MVCIYFILFFFLLLLFAVIHPIFLEIFGEGFLNNAIMMMHVSPGRGCCMLCLLILYIDFCSNNIFYILIPQAIVLYFFWHIVIIHKSWKGYEFIFFHYIFIYFILLLFESLMWMDGQILWDFFNISYFLFDWLVVA